MVYLDARIYMSCNLCAIPAAVREVDCPAVATLSCCLNQHAEPIDAPGARTTFTLRNAPLVPWITSERRALLTLRAPATHAPTLISWPRDALDLPIFRLPRDAWHARWPFYRWRCRHELGRMLCICMHALAHPLALRYETRRSRPASSSQSISWRIARYDPRASRAPHCLAIASAIPK